MTPERALAEQIYHINESVRRSAIEHGEELEVGAYVTIDEIEAGINIAGLYKTEQIVDDLTDTETDDPMFEENCGKFCDWMNKFVYFPIASNQIDLMIEDGLLEVKGIDAETGEFTYGLTAKGYEDWHSRNQ
jgi:hypothetical protein